MTSLHRLLLPVATALALTAAAAVGMARGSETRAGDIVVSAAWARATPPNAEVAAAYLTIENAGEADDRVTAVASSAAGRVSLHETAEADGVMTMRPLADPSIPAGGALTMKPGGVHAMLEGLKAPLKAGAPLIVTLTFEHAGPIAVPVEIRPLGATDARPEAMDAMPGMDHSGHTASTE